MDNFLDKIFFRSRNLDYISQNLKNITNQTPAYKIFEALEKNSSIDLSVLLALPIIKNM